MTKGLMTRGGTALAVAISALMFAGLSPAGASP